jgi:hypothetical protein
MYVILPRALAKNNKLLAFFVKMPIVRIVPYVTNISSCSKHYRKHASVHSEVSADVLNRFGFIVGHFRPVSPTTSRNV